MDKESLNYMAKKVESGKILTKRIERLESIKEKLTAKEAILHIRISAYGRGEIIDEGITDSYMLEKYKSFVLDGVNAELEELKKEFEAL